MREPWVSTDGDAPSLNSDRDALAVTDGVAARQRPGPVADRADDVLVPVDLRRVRRVLWSVTGVLVVMDFVAAVAGAYDLLPYLLLRFFDGDVKVNFPTGGKTTLLLASTLLMLACWAAGRRVADPAARGWALLAAGTAFAFVDETTYLHQTLSEALQKAFHFDGVLKYSWTIVYMPAAVVVGFFVLRNLRLMRPEVRNRILPGGAVFVLGALLMEPFKSHISHTYGDRGLIFRATAATSDSLELVGLTLLVIGLLIALGSMTSKFSFVLGSPSAPRDGAR